MPRLLLATAIGVTAASAIHPSLPSSKVGEPSLRRRASSRVVLRRSTVATSEGELGRRAAANTAFLRAKKLLTSRAQVSDQLPTLAAAAAAEQRPMSRAMTRAQTDPPAKGQGHVPGYVPPHGSKHTPPTPPKTPGQSPPSKTTGGGSVELHTLANPLGVIYWADVAVGTPPQTISVILDTGSGATVIPSIECVDEGQCLRAPSYPHGYYDARSSTSFESTSCDCGSSEKPCWDRTIHAGSTGACYFNAGYTDGTDFEGELIVEKFAFAGVSKKMRVGRALQSTPGGPALPALPAYGIMGLLPYSEKANCAPSCADSFASNLTAKHGGFTLRLGRTPNPEMVLGTPTMPMLPPLKSYTEQQKGIKLYSVCMGAIEVDGKAMGEEILTAFNHITLIDSGSSLVILPNALLDSIRSALRGGHGAGRVSRCHVPGLCGNRSIFDDGWMLEQDFQQHKKDLPDIVFHFSGVRLPLTAEEYLMKVKVNDVEVRQLAIAGTSPGSDLPATELCEWDGTFPELRYHCTSIAILGDTLLKRFDVGFNPIDGSVGFGGPAVQHLTAGKDKFKCTTKPPIFVTSFWLPIYVLIGAAVIVLAALLAWVVFTLFQGAMTILAVGLVFTAILLFITLISALGFHNNLTRDEAKFRFECFAAVGIPLAVPVVCAVCYPLCWKRLCKKKEKESDLKQRAATGNKGPYDNHDSGSREAQPLMITAAPGQWQQGAYATDRRFSGQPVTEWPGMGDSVSVIGNESVHLSQQ